MAYIVDLEAVRFSDDFLGKKRKSGVVIHCTETFRKSMFLVWQGRSWNGKRKEVGKERLQFWTC